MKKKLLALMLADVPAAWVLWLPKDRAGQRFTVRPWGETSEAPGEEVETSGESGDAAPQESAAPTEPPFEVDTSLSGELTVLDCFRNSNPGALTALEWPGPGVYGAPPQRDGDGGVLR